MNISDNAFGSMRDRVQDIARQLAEIEERLDAELRYTASMKVNAHAQREREAAWQKILSADVTLFGLRLSLDELAFAYGPLEVGRSEVGR